METWDPPSWRPILSVGSKLQFLQRAVGTLVVVCVGNLVEWPIGESIKCIVLNRFTLSLAWSSCFPVLLLMLSLFIFGVFGNI